MLYRPPINQGDQLSQESYQKVLEKLDKRNGSKYPMIDSLVHIVDFTQNTYDLHDLVDYMDQTNITKAVICGLGVTKIHAEFESKAPEYYLDDDSGAYYYAHTDVIVAEQYKKLSPKNKERFYPLICGFNLTDKYAIRHIEYMFSMYPGVFRGIGEVLFRHDDLTLMTQGSIARPNNPAMFPIYEFCAEYELPIVLHQNITSVGTSNYPKYLHELEEVLQKFPKTKIQFTHCGVSRRINAPYYTKMIERLLLQYPMLYVDFTWIMYDELVCKNGVLNQDWLEFAEKYSTRIMIGSDNVGDYHKIGIEVSKFTPLLDALSKEARENITINNVERLYANTKNRVENGKKRTYPLLEDIVLENSDAITKSSPEDEQYEIQSADAKRKVQAVRF